MKPCLVKIMCIILEKECNSSDLELVHLRISNGEVIKSQYSSGDKVSVACLQGYTMNGTGSIECKNDGQWQFYSICKGNGLFIFMVNNVLRLVLYILAIVGYHMALHILKIFAFRCFVLLSIGEEFNFKTAS